MLAILCNIYVVITFAYWYSTIVRWLLSVYNPHPHTLTHTHCISFVQLVFNWISLFISRPPISRNQWWFICFLYTSRTPLTGDIEAIKSEICLNRFVRYTFPIFHSSIHSQSRTNQVERIEFVAFKHYIYLVLIVCAHFIIETYFMWQWKVLDNRLQLIYLCV